MFLNRPSLYRKLSGNVNAYLAAVNVHNYLAVIFYFLIKILKLSYCFLCILLKCYNFYCSFYFN